MKRKEREEERESRKRQKMEDAEQRKKAREEERLSRLSTQVDERLFKEACFQREKVVLLAAKAMGKEFARRRKAAEVVSSHMVESSTDSDTNRFQIAQSESSNNLQFGLPSLSHRYDEEVLRVWDFVHSFQVMFDKMNELSPLPTLDSIQNAVNSLRGGPKYPEDKTFKDKTVGIENNGGSKIEAIELLTNVAIALCRPLVPGLLKILSSVLSSNISSQSKDNLSIVTDASSIAGSDESLLNLTVNNLTWKEIARQSLIGDALMELGYSKQECSHVLRGYRSGGHPNSKEARRLRRGEDF
eukprot:10172655-Ditylum_brightwellii.AAC.1